MKKALLMSILFCIIICSSGSYAKSSEQSLDQIVAVVNDDVVTKSELNRALSTVKIQLTQSQQPVPTEDVLHKQVMDQLINRKLQLQIAKQAGINISDAEVDQAVGRVAQQNNVSVETLYQRINQEGMTTADYRNEIRDQMTIQKVQQQEVVGHINISQQEVASFMRSKAWQNFGTKEYHLQDILIPLSDAPSPTEIATAKNRAEAILAKLKQGQNFNTVAQSESGDTHALQGGDLGWRKLPEIPSAFSEVVSRMQTKEIAGPIQTPNGFHLIRLIAARSSGAQATPNQKQIENLLLQRKFEEAVQNWVSKLRSTAFINTNPDINTNPEKQVS